jgi:hypothetical protein
MKRVSRQVAWLGLQAIFWLFRAPIVFAIGLMSLSAIRKTVGDTVACATCGQEIPLLGLWECGGCSYSWYGWYFSRCEACGDIPPWVECGRCGASTMNPWMFSERGKR